MAKGLWTVINVDNVEKSVEFYRALGLKARVDDAGIPGMDGVKIGTLDLGGSGLVIWNKHVVPEDQPEDTQAWVSGDLGKGVLFTLGVPNAQKLWPNVQKIRAEVDQPLEEQPWGGHGFTVVDPDGYVINISDRSPDMTPKKATKKVAKKTKTAAKKGKGKRR